MGGFSKNSFIFLSRLLVAGIIVLGGFHFGSAFYIADLSKRSDKTETRSLAEEINNSPVGGIEIYIQGNKKIFFFTRQLTNTP